LAFYFIIVTPVYLFVFLRTNPFKYYAHFIESGLLAAAAAAGAVCIPKNIEICDDIGIDPRISRFAIPFSTTLQGDGSALFQVMSCVFLANFFGVSLTVSNYITMMIMAVILCLCVPSVPSSSIVTVLVILNSVNLGYLNIGMLYTVDWLLDRMRTFVNLYSHCFIAVVVFELTKSHLPPLEKGEFDINLGHIYGIEKVNETFDMNNNDQNNVNKYMNREEDHTLL
jgi:Na+/H+-dicarboxylate symporter